MALPDVLDADQVYLSGGTLTDQRLRIHGGVQVAMISVFPGKVVTGDYTRDTEQLASTHTFATWTGGMLVKRMDPTTQADRSYRPQMDTRFPRQATSLLAVSTATGSQPANTTPAVLAVYNDTVYVGFSDTSGVASSKVRTLNANGSTWDTPASVVDSDTATVWTDALPLRLSSTNWLVLAFGTGYVQYDGSTWTKVSADDSATPKARFLCEWDQRLWALSATQNKLWVTTDLSTWTAKAVLPEYAGEVTRLLLAYDASGEQILHALTKSAVWLYDATADKWYKTGARWPRHRYGGAGACTWQGTLYWGVGAAMYAYDGRTMRSLGLDRDHGLPKEFDGRLNSLCDGFRWLWAGTTPKNSSNLGALLAYDGVGWHCMRVPSTDDCRVLGFTTFGGNDATYLFFAESTAVRYLTFPLGSDNPLDNDSYRFATGGATIDTPWFDANWQELSKLALELRCAVENADASNTWAVYYAIDDNESYSTSGMTALATGQTATSATLQFGSGAGIVFKRIRFKFLTTKAANTHPPLNFQFGTFKYLKLLDPLYGYTFAVDGSAGYLGDSVPTQFAALQTACSTQTLLTAKFLKEGQEIITRKVKVTRFTAERYPGADGRFRATVSLSEV